jgi:hypothetical protein
VQRVAGGVVGLAHGLELGLDVAQLGQAGFQRVGRFGDGALHALLFLAASRCFRNHSWCSFSVPCSCSARYCVATSACFSSFSRLLFSSRRMSSTRVRFSRVSFSRFSVSRRRSLYLLTPGGLFEEQAQFLGARLDDAADGALADDGVGARAQAGAEEHVLHVAPAHRLVVDVVAAGAVAREHALDGDLGELFHCPPARASLLSNTSSTLARLAGLRWPLPLKMTSCMDSPRSSLALLSPSTQRTASMMLDLPQPLGPTTPTRWPGSWKVVGSAKDLKPESLIWFRRMEGDAQGRSVAFGRPGLGRLP